MSPSGVDTNGLSLSTTTSFVRSTVYSWYDEAHRLSARGNYGSGDSGDNWKYATVPARPSSAPGSSSASVLLTEYAYDTVSGRLQTVTDPEGQVAKTVYDDLGRTLYAISNYVNFNESTEANTGGTDKSEDQVVKTVYNGLGQVTTLTALDQNGDGSLSDNEVTTYTYEDAYNAGLPTTVTYPDSTGGSDVVTMTYYLDGLVKQKTDQRGVVIDKDGDNHLSGA